MKKILFLLLCTLLGNVSFAQATYDYKRDYQWILGYNFNNLSGSPSNIYMDFDIDIDSMVIYQKPFVAHSLFQTNASICDTAGHLLFYSNGCVVVDADHQFFDGVDTINMGPKWESYCHYVLTSSTDGYNVVNGCWIVPVGSAKFKVLYSNVKNSFIHTEGIFMSSVELLDGSLIGSGVDVPLVQGDFQAEKNGIVRHGNGKSWWRIDEAYDEELYYITYIDDSDSIYAPKLQEFTLPINSDFHGGGQGVFSPDGTIYATFDARNECQVFDFDRCKGELSNPRLIPLPLPYDSIGASTGISISPNARFMYLSCALSLWQYDLWASDIEASKIRVANARQDLPTLQQVAFYQQQIGPDGKIYVFTPGSREFITVIEHPDSLGLACKVAQAKHFFPDLGFVAQPPRFPNYRLGPLEGSPCDTIDWATSNTSLPPAPKEASHMTLRPNPATDYFVADMALPRFSSDAALAIEVVDVMGRVVQRVTVPPYAALQRVEMADLAKGMYFVRLTDRGRVLTSKKLVLL